MPKLVFMASQLLMAKSQEAPMLDNDDSPPTTHAVSSEEDREQIVVIEEVSEDNCKLNAISSNEISSVNVAKDVDLK